MNNNQDPKRKLIPRSSGFLQDLTNRFRLISRLLMDSRVSPVIKALPIAALAYVVWPVDLLPVNPIDDALVIWLGTTLFVELCPPDVVQEHLHSMDRWPVSNKDQNSPGSSSNNQEGDIIDGEFFDIDTRK
jgi:hypothetical protein